MPRTQHRSVRVSDDQWSNLLMVGAREGIARGSVIRRLARLYETDPAVRAITRQTPDPLGDDTKE